jgi:hypothetical protein
MRSYWKHRQAQVYGGRIQRINRVGQIQPPLFAGVKLSGLSDQAVRELGIDAPVAQLVGIGRRGTGYRFADAMKSLPWQESMIWANKVLPTYIAISGSRKTARLHEARFAVQVGDTFKISECGIR